MTDENRTSTAASIFFGAAQARDAPRLIETIRCSVIGREGWRLLPQYRYCPTSARWRHVREAPGSRLRLLDLCHTGAPPALPEQPETVLAQYLADARELLTRAQGERCTSAEQPALPAEIERLRWFLRPEDGQCDENR